MSPLYLLGASGVIFHLFIISQKKFLKTNSIVPDEILLSMFQNRTQGFNIWVNSPVQISFTKGTTLEEPILRGVRCILRYFI